MIEVTICDDIISEQADAYVAMKTDSLPCEDFISLLPDGLQQMVRDFWVKSMQIQRPTSYHLRDGEQVFDIFLGFDTQGFYVEIDSDGHVELYDAERGCDWETAARTFNVIRRGISPAVCPSLVDCVDPDDHATAEVDVHMTQGWYDGNEDADYQDVGTVWSIPVVWGTSPAPPPTNTTNVPYMIT